MVDTNNRLLVSELVRLKEESEIVEFLRCYSYLGIPRYSYLDSDAPDELSPRLIAPRSLLPVARQLPLFFFLSSLS